MFKPKDCGSRLSPEGLRGPGVPFCNPTPLISALSEKLQILSVELWWIACILWCITRVITHRANYSFWEVQEGDRGFVRKHFFSFIVTSSNPKQAGKIKWSGFCVKRLHTNNIWFFYFIWVFPWVLLCHLVTSEAWFPYLTARLFSHESTHTHRVSHIKKPLDKQRNLRSAFPRQVRDVSGSISTVLIFKLLHFFHLSSTSNLPPTLRTQGMFHTFSSKLCHFMPLCIAAEQVTHICATASRQEVAAYSALT